MDPILDTAPSDATKPGKTSDTDGDAHGAADSGFGGARFDGGQTRRLGSLQAFQARITQKIAQAQSNSEVQPSWLSFKLGQVYAQLALHEVGLLMGLPEIVTLPLAGPWLSGMAVVNAQAITVLDLAVCLESCLESCINSDLGSELNALPSTVLGKVLSSVLSDSPLLDQIYHPNVDHSQAKLIMVSPVFHKQLAFKADSVLGILSTCDLDAMVSSHQALVCEPHQTKHDHDKHGDEPGSDHEIDYKGLVNKNSAQIIEHITLDAAGHVWLRFSLLEMLKNPAFLQHTAYQSA